MLWFIVTEAMLFVALFFGYFLLRDQNPEWPMDEPPKLGFALAMLVVLLASSGVVEWGRQRARRGDEGTARRALLVTLLLGLVFLVLQGFEYHEHLKTMLPTDDAYASMFYTITSVHGLHVILGLLMLAYVAILPRLGPGEQAATSAAPCGVAVLAFRRRGVGGDRNRAVRRTALRAGRVTDAVHARPRDACDAARRAAARGVQGLDARTAAATAQAIGNPDRGRRVSGRATAAAATRSRACAGRKV